ncbi:MAG: NADH-quinone oxidoreductase subunit H, partial [Acidobacteriota bacterium]|nr:NADH-quinone oxidoreductase subunit H [Acidobacteriota bacterium]
MEFIVITLIKFGVLAFIFMTTLAYLQWVERKVIAHVQVRMGPSRVGPHGLLQPLADVIKLITKEGVMPPHVNKLFYFLAPFLAVFMALLSISIIPFGGELKAFGYTTWLQMTDLNVGVLFILAVSSMGVYGIALGGWASNNKYSLLGGLRSSAQMISYELPLSLALASPLLLVGTLSLREIVQAQAGFNFHFLPRWTIFSGPFPQIFSFFIFLIAGFAETNRIPFDLPEAENELVAGFHTEYSSMKFACFFMSEYANMITISCVATLLFLGGWHPLFPAPYSNWVPTLVFLAAALVFFFQALQPARKRDRITMPIFGVGALVLAVIWAIPFLQTYLVPIFWFASKAGFILFTYIWVRGTLPRFRYDQLMHFAWTFLFP